MKVVLTILPFENLDPLQRSGLIFLRNRHLSRRKAYDKTMLAVTSEVSKGNMASLNFRSLYEKLQNLVRPLQSKTAEARSLTGGGFNGILTENCFVV